MSTAPEISLDFRNTNTLWCSVLVETLVRCGVRRVVISPGSRSAPLTLAFTRHPRIEAIPVLDERSAAFFALGLAKQRGRPVALVCTSGTAAANFLPAIVEAHESGVPLLVLTADRPPELRDCHSGQTIDQHKLYGRQVNLYHELAVPQATLPKLRTLRETLVQAVAHTVSPAAGPVHLNCPFRDPLVPIPENRAPGLSANDLRGFFRRLVAPTVGGVVSAKLALGFKPGPRGIIIVGSGTSATSTLAAKDAGRLSRALGWPVLADALTPLRTQAAAAGHLVVHYDAILRNEQRAGALRPGQVICVGGWPTSKVLRAWLQRVNPKVALINAQPGNFDGLHLRTVSIRSDLAGVARAFRGRHSPGAYGWEWLRAEAQVGRALTQGLKAAKGLIEPKWPGVLATHLPAGTPCFIASSMPVRDAEYFWPAGNRGQQFFFNRGANGIDGTLSTALGVAHGNARPAVLVTGDLALLHDTNGFLSVPKFQGSLTIVLINNNGGGIFEHLPVAQFNPPFEEFFATPQNINFAKLCATYGVTHVAVKHSAQLARLVAKLPKTGVRVLELRTDRKRDAAFRRELFARLAG